MPAWFLVFINNKEGIILSLPVCTSLEEFSEDWKGRQQVKNLQLVYVKKEQNKTESVWFSVLLILIIKSGSKAQLEEVRERITMSKYYEEIC